MANDDALALVRKDREDASHWHKSYANRIDRWYRVYRGILDSRSEAAQWTSKLHPPYALQVAETIVANLIGDKLRFRGRPRPRVESDLDYLQDLQKAAMAQEYLVNAQLDRMRFHEKRRPFYLQNVIAGTTALKVCWRKEHRNVRRREQNVVPVLDDYGQIVGSRLEEQVVRKQELAYDDPHVEVVDMRDFWWNPGGAREFDRVTACTHRVWMTYEELERLQAEGVYSNVAKLKDTRDLSGDLHDREDALFSVSRTKGMIQVEERWSADRVITVGNSNVVLRDEENPYWHGQLPFVVCSTRPDLFRIPGVSEIEQIADLQEALWTLMNQRLDNTALLNNAIFFFRGDVDDSKFEAGPGERVYTEGDPQGAVYAWSPNPITAQISVPAEQAIRGDIQNISGAAPFISGTDSGTVDQQTATGVSIITTLAQRILSAKKDQGDYSLTRMVDQICWLNRQYISENRVIALVGRDGAAEYFTVAREHLDPDILFDFDASSESLMRQERRSESQALLQMGLQVAPWLATLAQAKAAQGLPGRTVDVEALFLEHLRAYDKDDPERFLTNVLTPAAPSAPGQPQAPGANGDGGVGVTSPLATDPSSPSNDMSLSGMQFGQRFMSQFGRQS